MILENKMNNVSVQIDKELILNIAQHTTRIIVGKIIQHLNVTIQK